MSSSVPSLQRQGSSDFVMHSPKGDVVLTSNNEKIDGFLLVHESPVSKRRQLRSSRELTAEEKAALSRQLCLDREDCNEMGRRTETGVDDEIGAVITPLPDKPGLTKRPTYKNGRRLTKELQVEDASEPTALSSPTAKALGPTKGSPHARDATPESPTGVIGSFFGDILGKSSALGKTNGSFLDGLVG